MCLTTQWKADCQITRFHFSQPNCTCWFSKLHPTERIYEMSNADKRACFILWWKLAWQTTSASCFSSTQSSYLVCQLAESLWLLVPMKSNLKIYDISRYPTDMLFSVLFHQHNLKDMDKMEKNKHLLVMWSNKPNLKMVKPFIFFPF